VIVIDASALMEVLLKTDAGTRLADRLLQAGELLHVPHLLDLEIVPVLRHYCLIRALQPNRAAEALVTAGWHLRRSSRQDRSGGLNLAPH